MGYIHQWTIFDSRRNRLSHRLICKERTAAMTIQWTRRIRAAVAMSLLFLLASCASSRAQFPIQQYVPTSRELLPLGELFLSNTQLQFAALQGQMKLQYVGIMPDSAGPDIAGATIYRVKNAEAYFRKNGGNEAFCSTAPLWVAVSSENGAPAWSNEIWVGLLTLDNWENFKAPQDQACLSGNYVRTG